MCLTETLIVYLSVILIVFNYTFSILILVGIILILSIEDCTQIRIVQKYNNLR